MKFHIETDRLLLREFRETDDSKLFELDSNPEVHKYLGNNPITKIEQAQNVIQLIKKQYEVNGIARWITIEKSTGDIIGWSGLKLESEIDYSNTFYDVGYRFIPKYWGKGYATEACKAALAYGFQSLNVTEIIGTANIENKASRRVLEKCGLTYIKPYMWRDIPCDWLKITKQEWELIQV